MRVLLEGHWKHEVWLDVSWYKWAERGIKRRVGGVWQAPGMGLPEYYHGWFRYGWWWIRTIFPLKVAYGFYMSVGYCQLTWKWLARYFCKPQ